MAGKWYCDCCGKYFYTHKEMDEHKNGASMAVEIRNVEIPKSVYDGLLESQRVVEAMEGISRHLKDSGDYLFYCHHVAYGWYAFITTHDKGIVNIDEVTFGAVGDTYSAAIRALHEQVKPKGDL